MTKETLLELEKILSGVVEVLPNVSAKKMFGCQAYWARDNVFALVWKEGRIGIKLPDEKSYTSLLKLAGADPWKAGPRQMAHWVLVPASFHTGPRKSLAKWVAQAHAQCLTPGSKVKSPKKKIISNKAKGGN